jgi:myo-inositol-1(or 4)-monophosphatase
MDEYLAFARELADLAGDTIMPYFQGNFESEFKSDDTPVTEVDRRTEKRLREQIDKAWPDHGIIGEEYGVKEGTSEWTWVLDPIDGTVSFMHGVPLFGVLIALTMEGEPHLGIMHFPALQETLWAVKGGGCYYKGRRAQVRPCANLKDATLCSSGLHNTDIQWPDGPPAGQPCIHFAPLVRRVRQYRAWTDCFGHSLIATGRTDIMVDPVMAPWDVAALVPVLEEAGAKVTDLDGNREDILNRGSLVSTAGAIHEEVLQILRGEQSD